MKPKGVFYMSVFLIGGLKLKRQVEPLGTIDKRNMSNPDNSEWILPRINPSCENCGNNSYYSVDVTYTKPFIVSPWGKANQIHRIVCPECGETIELDIEEYRVLAPHITNR